jgi:tetratricopeptide (TPR) repeat protein
MAAPDPSRLLRDAHAAARRVPAEPGARPLVERVAAAAVARGRLDVAREILLDLEEPGGKAWLHAELAAALLSSGEPEAAARHLGESIALLEDPGRWRPRGAGWIGPDAARARLARLYARLGDRGAAIALAESLPRGRVACAEAWVAVADRAVNEGEDSILEDWERARGAVLAIGDVEEGRRAREALARVACRRGDAVRAASLAHADLQAALAEPIPRALLAERIGLALAESGRPEAAGRTWARAVHSLLEGPGSGYAGTELVCRIALHQLEVLGPEAACATLARAVACAAAEPLAPEPDLRYGWRLLYQVALDHPALAGPLRDLLRSQARVPPGWCYVLGLLEAATGHPQRARWAAEALDRGHEVNPEDGESAWLAALLWLHIGELATGVSRAQQALSFVAAGHVAVVPGRRGAPARLERLFGEALLAAGLKDEAVTLARTTQDPLMRAELLARAAELHSLEGGRPVALALCREAAAALSELPPGQPAQTWMRAAAAIVGMMEHLGAPEAASPVLDRAVDAASAAPGALALAALTELAGCLDRMRSPGADRPRQALGQRIAQTPDPEDRALLLLEWLDAEHPVIGV